MITISKVACLVILLTAGVAQAGNRWWDGGAVDIVTDGDGASAGGAGTWNTATLNWDAGASSHVAWVNANNDTAIFAGTAGTVTLGGNVQVGGLTFNTADYIITNSTLTFGVAGTISNAVTATIRSVIAGSAAMTITKAGAGTLVFSGTNTYAGPTIVRGGTLLLDGGVVSNNSALKLGAYDVENASLVLTNGARFVAGGTHYIGERSSTNTMTVVGGTATSTFNGGNGALYVCYAREVTENNNRLMIGAGGVVTNVSTLLVGDGGAYGGGNSASNHLVVTDGGKLFATASLRIGIISATGAAACSATYNTGLIANGGVVRFGGEVYIGGLRPETAEAWTAQYSFNSLTITNGGQLYSGGTTSFIGHVRSSYTTCKANSNTVTIAGSLNGTNALWDLGNKPLFVGYTTNASTAIGNVLSVNAGGVATNISRLTVSATNTLSLGAGGQIYASAVTNFGTMAVSLDDTVTPACGRLTVSGELNLNNTTLTFVTNGVPAATYVIASYGSLTGAFAATNGVPRNHHLDMNYKSLNQVALVGPPGGTLFIIR